MSGKNIAVFGIYPQQMDFEKGLYELKSSGFRHEDISVLVPENLGSKEIATEKTTMAPEGAAAGVTSGALVGGVLGWLAGVGKLAIPGVGPLLAAGPIVAALAGLGVGGAVGGFTGALIGLGIPQHEAKRNDGRIRKGGILLSIHCDDAEWSRRAQEILERNGAEDISATGEAAADFAKSDRPLPATGTEGD
jgi:hypothetical protein